MRTEAAFYTLTNRVRCLLLEADDFSDERLLTDLETLITGRGKGYIIIQRENQLPCTYDYQKDDEQPES